MNTTVFFCRCGDNVAAQVDGERVAAAFDGGTTRCVGVDFLCSEEGKQFMREELAAHPGRVVAAACSPRDHESTFQGVMKESGVNPYLLQVVNIREQVAWVTPDPEQATSKAIRAIRAGVARVEQQTPLMERSVDTDPNVVVIGAGPAGLKCAEALARAGRKVTVVEKTAVLGGLPVRYEELFPRLECGPCLLEPMLGEVMHGRSAERIDVNLLSEVTEVVGYEGNFTATVKTRPRYVDPAVCIGCNECIPPCPVSRPNPYDYRLGERKAIDYPFAGALPNAPTIDDRYCLRFQGESCTRCREACPVPEAIVFDDSASTKEVKAGAIVLATGFALYDCSKMPELGYGLSPRVITNLEWERMLAANGPTQGQVIVDGRTPRSVVIIHCAGSLDEDHVAYCSSVCCSAALKESHMASAKHPEMRFLHLYKELVVPGKDAFVLLEHARHDPRIELVRYQRVRDVTVVDNGLQVDYVDAGGKLGRVEADLVVLCPPVVPGESTKELARRLDVDLDRFGFFEELQGRLDAGQSKRKGVYLAGACQGPMDIQSASSQGMAVAGYVLASLVEGRKLEIDPVTAVVETMRCSGCRICVPVCPYKAIGFELTTRKAAVNDQLCQGCGTCVAACPSGAMQGPHFTSEQIHAEMEALLLQ